MAWCASLAAEVAGQGVRVNAIAPGWIESADVAPGAERRHRSHRRKSWPALRWGDLASPTISATPPSFSARPRRSSSRASCCRSTVARASAFSEEAGSWIPSPQPRQTRLVKAIRVGRFVRCCFFATTINYMDRQILGLLAPMLQRQIGWTESQYAHIVTAFQAAYAIGLLGFGRLIDKLGTSRGYFISVLLWSIAAAGHAPVRSVFGFGLCDLRLGLGEAGNFPAAVKAVAEWFPKRVVRPGQWHFQFRRQCRRDPGAALRALDCGTLGMAGGVCRARRTGVFLAGGVVSGFTIRRKISSRLPRRACTYIQ